MHSKIKVIYLYGGLVQLLFPDDFPKPDFRDIYRISQCDAGQSTENHGAHILDNIILTKERFVEFRDAEKYKDWFDDTENYTFKVLINFINGSLDSVISNHPNSHIVLIDQSEEENEWPVVHDLKNPDTHLGNMYDLFKNAPPDESEKDREWRSFILLKLLNRHF